MTARKTYLFVLPLILFVLFGCRATSVTINRQAVQGSGERISENRPVSDIQRVSMRDVGELVITQGDSESLTVEADDNIMPHIQTEMRGRELVLQIAEGISIHSKANIRYILKVKDLNRIQVAGAGNLQMDSLDTQDFTLKVSGAGNVTFGSLEAKNASIEISGGGKVKIGTLMADSLDVISNGAGDFEIAGETPRQKVTITGAGNYHAGNLKSSEADLHINGAGNMTVWVEEKLSVSVAGFGTVSYYGAPKVSQNIAGGGNVKNLGEHK